MVYYVVALFLRPQLQSEPLSMPPPVVRGSERTGRSYRIAHAPLGATLLLEFPQPIAAIGGRR